MLERFAQDARNAAEGAHEEARVGGSATVEAEHVLLALTAPDSGLAAEVLAAAGLGRTELRAALDAEWERSLRAAGFTHPIPPPPAENAGGPRRAARGREPRWAASAKDALKRSQAAAKARGDRRIGSGHVLLGVLGAREGTVPRALDGAGVAPAELAARTSAALDAERRAAAA
jgi:D-alanyl-D-alanine carboxypeptidase